MSKKPSVFLERDRYRTRRLVDGLRVFPILAAVLWIFPVLWTYDAENPPNIALGAIYLFCTWATMIGISFVLVRRLRNSAEFWQDDQSGRKDRD